jgi:hypothetical protein
VSGAMRFVVGRRGLYFNILVVAIALNLASKCYGKLLPILHMGKSFDELINQSPASYMASRGGSSMKCGVPSVHNHLRSCLMQNVCIDMSKDFMIGHNGYKVDVYGIKKNSAKKSSEYYFPRTQKYREGPKVYQNLNLPFVQLTESRKGGRNDISNPFSHALYFIEKPIVLVDILYGDNYGHMYVDYVMSAFAGARGTDQDITEFAFMPSKFYSYNSTKKFEHYLSSLLKVPLSHDLKKYFGNSICFSKLLLPGYHGLFSNSSTAVTHFSRGLRDEIFRLHATTSLSQSPRILMVYKKQHLSVHGGRILLNVDEVRSALVSRFGSSTVEMLDLGEVSLEQQLSLLRNVSVFVSPLGGSSFSAMLLPDNAVFVQIQAFNTVTNKSEPLVQHDYDTFQKMKHIRILQHSVRRDEIVIESNAKAKTKRMKFSKSFFVKTLGNFQLDVNSLLKTIETALLLADE